MFRCGSSVFVPSVIVNVFVANITSQDEFLVYIEVNIPKNATITNHSLSEALERRYE